MKTRPPLLPPRRMGSKILCPDLGSLPSATCGGERRRGGRVLTRHKSWMDLRSQRHPRLGEYKTLHFPFLSPLVHDSWTQRVPRTFGSARNLVPVEEEQGKCRNHGPSTGSRLCTKGARACGSQRRFPVRDVMIALASKPGLGRSSRLVLTKCFYCIWCGRTSRRGETQG